MNSKVLVLNNAYEPINMVGIRRALALLGKGRAAVVEPGDEVVRTAHTEISVPSVIKLNRYVGVPRRGATWSARGVLERDNYTCQYCGQKLNRRAKHGAADEATVDHIVPRSHFEDRSKASTWSNTCCACGKCNRRKGNRLLKDMADVSVMDGNKAAHEVGMRFFNPNFVPRRPRVNYLVATSDVDPRWRVYLRENKQQFELEGPHE